MPGSLDKRHAQTASPTAQPRGRGRSLLESYAREDLVDDDGADYILNKMQGVGHGGGVQVAAGTVDHANMERFLALLGEEVTAVAITPQTLFDTVTMAPVRKTLRRAALIFAGRNPTDAEYAAAQGGAAALRATIRGMMTGPEFHEFLIRGANDRLLTDREDSAIISVNTGNFVALTNENYRRSVARHAAGGTDRAWRTYYEWFHRTQHGFRRAPLELIAHVVENDRPYTEILTADYIMANPWAAEVYGASTRFDDPKDENEFKPSRILAYYIWGEGYESEHDFVVGAKRVLEPGPLLANYPHAGILNTNSFLLRYPTTTTNRNRARSRWTYYHFLGLDIEKSTSRTTDPVALADTNNPTLRNPACTVCHRVLDPVAGTFQNYSDDGRYRIEWNGLDSLDRFYKEEDGGPSLAVRADSWRDRETLSFPVWMEAGEQILRVMLTNPFCDEDSETCGNIYLDRMTVKDGGGGVLARHEFEDLGPPIRLSDSRPCGQTHRNPSGHHVRFWSGWGKVECAFFVDVEIPSDGVHEIEVIAWADQHEELYEKHTGERFAKLAVAVNAYREGDTWYRDMRSPGFADERAPDSDNSVQWLAKQIVADDRFAEATVKFWWPAIMGSEVAEPPEDEADADFEGLLLAANAQDAEVTRLANEFRRGIRGRAAYNLKDLLVEIVFSKWFRADAVEDADPVRQLALRDAGARRLLTPEELARKTFAVTGLQWGRHVRADCYPQCEREPNALTHEYRLLYGGIDSDGITERARDVTSVMAGVAKRHAAEVSCPAVMRELYLVPEGEKRRLFAGISRFVTPGLEFGASFEIEAGSRVEKETLSFGGALTAGSKTVRLFFTNPYRDESTGTSRGVHLDRLDVRNSAGRIVLSRELEELSSGDCNGPGGDHFALWCEPPAEVPIEIPAAGEYTIEVVAWADQAGGELPLLSVVVESDAAGSAGENAIRSKLVELYDKLLGVQVTPHSSDVESAYRLFVDVHERGREAGDRWPEWWHCSLRNGIFDGILGDAVVEYEQEDGYVNHDFDWGRVHLYMDGIDWSDSHHTAQAWVVVLAYLLMDYRYLYL